MNELVGPLPEPSEAPKYPTPWKVTGNTIFTADGKEVMTIGGQAAALMPIITDAVNAYVNAEANETPLEYWRQDYTFAAPDYYEVYRGRVVRSCDSEAKPIEWEEVESVWEFLQDDCTRIYLNDLPSELK